MRNNFICPDCKGAGFVDETVEEDFTPCWSCSGTGYAAEDEYDPMYSYEEG